ncbi:MAG: Mrp/NBP35 family ATP-binding protein [Oligoflexia bacterium]|nr:Mrp/NBP35 family ATP-binding protein [Oligoflexia bacterium]
MSNPFDQKAPIPNVQNIVLVGSGKGGVGKSTVSLNLAVALSKLDLKAGLLDADLYGPSVPRLTGTIYLKPELNENNKLLPIRRYGINLMSMGHLVEEESPLVWRGPMLFKAIEQFFRDVHWGNLDVLVIDLPPGTGDVALTIAQKAPVSGGIVVSTPQNLSLTDTKKALNMFRQIEIPILGVVENMSYYLSDKGEKVDMFPRGQIDIYLKEKKVDKLAVIPFHPHVGLSCEAGVPLLESQPDSEEGKAISLLAEKVKKYLLGKS